MSPSPAFIRSVHGQPARLATLFALVVFLLAFCDSPRPAWAQAQSLGFKQAPAAAPTVSDPEAPERADALAARSTTLPRPKDLHFISLAEGDVGGFDIDYRSNTGRTKYSSSEWRELGKKGVKFKGADRDLTHVRPVGEHCIFFDSNPGVVWLEDMTVHAGTRTAVFSGMEHVGQPVKPGFKLVMRNVRVVADAPTITGQLFSTVWLLFLNNCDLDLQNVILDGSFAAEHDIYGHGFSSGEWVIDRLVTTGSGSQGVKMRNSPNEVQFVPNARITIRNSDLRNWMRPGGWRGGAAITLEGSHASLDVDSCIFWGGDFASGGGLAKDLPASQRAFAIAIDDAGGDCYSVVDGAIGTGIANGDIRITNCGFDGGPGAEGLSKQIRIGGLGSGRDGPNGRKVARSVTITGCGAYGLRANPADSRTGLQWQFSDIPAGKLRVSGCNTPEIREMAQALGLDTTFETMIPTASRLVPVSEGLVR